MLIKVQPFSGVRQNVRKFLISLCFLLLVCQVLGAQASEPNATEPSLTASSQDPEYIIGVEDVLSINVWKEPELTLPQIVVRPDGKITIPLINDIQADGLTARQLQDKITGDLKEYVASPNVTVTVLQVLSNSVSIVGQVSVPGTYTMGTPMTVLEVLARAGGLLEYAKKKDIKVIRSEYGRTQQFSFNYKDIIKGKNLKQNIQLQRGDIILVP